MTSATEGMKGKREEEDSLQESKRSVPEAVESPAAKWSRGRKLACQQKVRQAVLENRPRHAFLMLRGLPPDVLEYVLNVNEINKQGVFQLAARKGNKRLVQTLLDMGADVNGVDGDHEAALHGAVYSNNLAIVQLLVRAGARLDIHKGTQDSDGQTCFEMAVRRNAIGIVKYFLHLGMDIDMLSDDTVLNAVGQCHLQMLQLILKRCKGFSLDKCFYKCSQDLMNPRKHGHLEVAKFLLELGADPNRGSLYFAAKESLLNFAKLLLEKGADINMTNEDGTVLHVACKKGHMMMVQYLLHSGARTDLIDGNGKNCLMVACEANNASIVQIILEGGADPNFQSPSGSTPLHVAARADAVEVGRLLLNRGARVLRDKEGNTPMRWAALNFFQALRHPLINSWDLTQEEKVEALELLAAQAALHHKEQVYQYLHRAMEERHSDMSDVLWKPTRPPVAALGNVVESQTLEELESRQLEQDTLQWECVLAVERTLGSEDPACFDYFIQTCYDLCQQNRNSEAVALYTYMLKLPFTWKSTDFLRDLLMHTHSFTFEEFEQLLEGVIFNMEERSLLVPLSTCRWCVQSAFQVATDADERRRLKVVVKSLIAAQSRIAYWENDILHQNTMLHLAVTSNLDEQAVPLVAFLVDCGADVNSFDSFGNTPMHSIVSCWDRCEPVLQITRILVKDAHLDLRNLENKTVLECAEYEEVKAILRAHHPPPLKCLVATALIKERIPYQNVLPKVFHNFITQHKPG